MSSLRPKFLEAETACARTDALYEFIEFWIGPRRTSYGEPAEPLSERLPPTPLKRLYEYAGRWTHREGQASIEYTVPAFSHQDSLLALHRLSDGEDGKLVFLEENQGVWDCRTLPEGEDPPVWCNGDQIDEQGGDFRGEKLVSQPSGLSEHLDLVLRA